MRPALPQDHQKGKQGQKRRWKKVHKKIEINFYLLIMGKLRRKSLLIRFQLLVVSISIRTATSKEGVQSEFVGLA